MKAILWGASVCLALLMNACGSPEPVATGYKKQLSSAAAAQGSGNAAATTPAPSASGSANLTNGKAIYDKSCAGCHGALASTFKPNLTVAQIDAAVKNAAHASLAANWPKGQAATDLSAALKK